MSGSLRKIVVDTNVFFMAFTNPIGKAGRVIEAANNGKVELISTDSVKEELSRVFKRELKMIDSEILFVIDSLPVKWFNKEDYIFAIDSAKVKHEPDKPIEALSLVFNCDILSADSDFKNRLDINALLDELNE